MNKQHDDIVSNSCNGKKKDSGDSGVLKLGSVRWHRNVNKRDGTLENISILRQSGIFFFFFFFFACGIYAETHILQENVWYET